MAKTTYPWTEAGVTARPVRSIEGVETGVPILIGYGAEAAGPLELHGGAEPDARFGRSPYRLGEAVRLFFENGGRRCYVVTVPEGGRQSAVDFHAGLAAAKDVHDADLVVLPDAMLLGADEYGALVRYVLKDCARMRRFAIFESREGVDFGAAWLSWGAAYPMAGAKAAGLIAGADAALGVWRAPVELHGGTLAREGEWRYAPVRRLSIMLERSIERGLEWAGTEPRKSELFTLVRGVTKHFLLDLWRRGAFAGGDPDNAFFVRCDGTVMGQEDLDDGDFIVEVSIAPLKPAEFVVLRIVQRASS